VPAAGGAAEGREGAVCAAMPEDGGLLPGPLPAESTGPQRGAEQALGADIGPCCTSGQLTPDRVPQPRLAGLHRPRWAD